MKKIYIEPQVELTNLSANNVLMSVSDVQNLNNEYADPEPGQL